MNGYMANFQLLGRYLRELSKPRDEHRFPVLRILHNLYLRKPFMRKAFITKSLRRINEPLRRISEPLRRINEPLQRKIDPHREKIRRIIPSFCAIIASLWRIIERVYSLTEAVEEKPKYFQQSYKPVHPYRNIELVHGINKDFKGNQNAKTSQVALGCQTVPFQFNSGPETINMKAVLNHSQSSFVITSNKCDKLNVSSEYSVNEASIAVYRLTVRKLSTQSKLD